MSFPTSTVDFPFSTSLNHLRETLARLGKLLLRSLFFFARKFDGQADRSWGCPACWYPLVL
jgi:hypothetical protein